MLPTTKYKKNPHPHANYMATLIGRLQTSLNDSRSFVHTVTPKTCTITCVRHVSIGCWDYEHLIPLYSRKIKCIEARLLFVLLLEARGVILYMAMADKILGYTLDKP